MALQQCHRLTQSQSLVMTNEMQIAIKLLALSNSEICSYVARELEHNPLLESNGGNEEVAARRCVPEGLESTDFVDGEADAKHELLGPSALGSQLVNDPAQTDPPLNANGGFAGDRVPSINVTGASTAAPRPTLSYHVHRGQDTSLDDWVGSKRSFYEYIDQEISLEFKCDADRRIAHVLASYLDGAGYLTASVGTLARHLNCSQARILAVLERLQRFEPAGLFARNLQECLAIQLVEKNMLDPTMRTILGNLPLVASAQLEKLASLCKQSLEEIVARVARLQQLNPKPLLAFDEAFAAHVEPDLILTEGQSGNWIIELNDKNLPKVAVNESYSEFDPRQSVQDQQYLETHRKSASWLVRSLRQRGETMIRVATAIVERQHEFFMSGVAYMRPLLLKDIAHALNLHESTISRATKNKFIQTPLGTFELNYFFSEALRGPENDHIQAAEAVRHRIQSLIDAEDCGNVLSDDGLAKKLSTEGVAVARRTVTKYRKLLRIPSAAHRKRRKKLTRSIAGAKAAHF